MNTYKIELIVKGQNVFIEIKSDNEFSALNVVRQSYEYDKIIAIDEIKQN